MNPTCIKCGVPLTDTNWYPSSQRIKQRTCKGCHKANHKKYMDAMGESRYAYRMFASAKNRAKKQGVPFDITLDDISIPSHCPVLGIPLKHSKGKRGPTDNSPTLDKIIPSKGYVRGNVVVISGKANRIKNDATLGELAAVTRWLLSQTSE